MLPCASDGDAVHEVELAGALAALPPRLHPVAVLVVFGDARVHVAVADVDVAVRIPGHVGRLAEAAIHMRQRRIGVALVRMGLDVGRFRLASEHHLDAAFRAELDRPCPSPCRSPRCCRPCRRARCARRPRRRGSCRSRAGTRRCDRIRESARPCCRRPGPWLEPPRE